MATPRRQETYEGDIVSTRSDQLCAVGNKEGKEALTNMGICGGINSNQ
jgi:hypothetical protein